MGRLGAWGLTGKTKLCNFVAGTACIIRTKSINNAEDLFDESLFMYHEDVDLSIRLVANGHRIGVAPRALVWHDSEVEPWVAYYVVRNLHWILVKNFGIQFYLRFLSRTARWTLMAAKKIASKGNGGAIKGTFAGISGAMKIAWGRRGQELNHPYLHSLPPNIRRTIIQKLKEGEDVIFHA